jgi:phosphohistidine phosphatase
MRTLLLMRHAKSDYPPGVGDRERPLAARGERDAEAAGVWLGATYPRLDLVIVSPARRARETWGIVEPHVQASRVEEDARVYEAWGAQLPDIVSSLADAVRTVLIVGHNPGIEECAARLARSGDAEAREAMSRKYPTSAIAALGFAEGWMDTSTAELVSFTVPRG